MTQTRKFASVLGAVDVPKSIFHLLIACAACSAAAVPSYAQEYYPRHYHPYNGANPRPDILPRTLYNSWVPYRAEYNRPTFIGGYLAHVIEPSSQEAISWEENHALGYYKTKCPTPIRHYYHPKPWEILDTGPRPSGDAKSDDFQPEMAPVDLKPTNPSPASQRY